MGLCKVIGQTFYDFVDRTSIAGLNNSVHRKSLAKKIYWLILFFLGTYFTCLGIVETVINFYGREVTTSTDLTHMPSVAFPAVSICNLNK